ncbi:MAG: guanylate kinase [Deltaproteobacteria bacterium GWA2_57_13]|nr:MAG: guanylate kinase [Deltaproteobacteria bacterium GWA2_57_13]OGQ49136.1 MAG: guanylate kinase [Deltaproteobacteria bacterium RIFCSPLOWO2_02_FULL_57_26]OGQ77105.1 MAG: guanylate kinase [Deltaproteobacteria bacterium RIFCSPLOWO2_12_FULL_57_22]
MRLSEVLTKREGIIYILSAPSGAGKTTLIKKLLAIFPEIRLIVSYTTRSRRAGESSGRDYHFVTEREFASIRSRGGFAEWAQVHGSFYGTPRLPLEQSIRRGRDALLDIDVQGAKKIKKQYPRAVSIFILPPSWRELARRLALRGTDRQASIRRRLDNARREIRQLMRYDYIVINREVQEALKSLGAIVVAERHRVSRTRG